MQSELAEVLWRIDSTRLSGELGSEWQRHRQEFMKWGKTVRSNACNCIQEVVICTVLCYLSLHIDWIVNERLSINTVASKHNAVNYVDILFSVFTNSLFFGMPYAIWVTSTADCKCWTAGEPFCSAHPCKIPTEASEILFKWDLQDWALQGMYGAWSCRKLSALVPSHFAGSWMCWALLLNWSMTRQHWE